MCCFCKLVPPAAVVSVSVTVAILSFINLKLGFLSLLFYHAGDFPAWMCNAVFFTVDTMLIGHLVTLYGNKE
jgi:hypothetical protein